ncbi:MAG: transcription antitermination factor NusB [Vicinamibacterales bacterium]
MKHQQRHRAREAALQILYQAEVARTDVAQAANTFFDRQWQDPQPPPEGVRSFATALAHETIRRLPESDTLIAETTERWRPERMAVIDRLILRMSIAEMLYDRETPAAVVINEALELARRFSTEESVKFINGMLDAVRRRMER